MRTDQMGLMTATALLALVIVVQSSSAQSAIEHHIWQDQHTFEPLSRTAMSITGPISLSGNTDFAEPGSTMLIAFNGGPPVELVSKGASWREWQLVGGVQTAEVFQVASDPGSLLNGNTVCGDALAYLVFSEGNLLSTDKTLEVAAFSSKKPPFDINSDGLCGTFTYLAE